MYSWFLLRRGTLSLTDLVLLVLLDILNCKIYEVDEADVIWVDNSKSS